MKVWKEHLWASKVTRIPILRISSSQLGNLGTKWHFGASPMARHKEYYKGKKVVISPKSRPWWILWVHVYLWFVCAPKVFQLCTNQLVVWFVQVHVNIDMLVTCPNPHLGTPARPSTLKCCKLNNVPQLLIFPLF